MGRSAAHRVRVCAPPQSRSFRLWPRAVQLHLLRRGLGYATWCMPGGGVSCLLLLRDRVSDRHSPEKPLSSSRKRLAAGLGLGMAVTGLGFIPSAAQAATDGNGLVISEVYGGGGNSGAVYRSDFIELFNPTAADIDLNGLSLQYRSVSGSPGGSPFALTGTVTAGSHYLVKAADGTNTALTALPTPDETSTFNIAGTGGQVLLVQGTAAFSGAPGDVKGAAGLVDMVGWGAATSF